MRLQILGCSGGVSPGYGTTSFLVDQNLLLDAGTGVERLTHSQMTEIHHIVLTHSHLDHVSHLPFLLNNLIGELEFTIHVYGIPHTIQALKKHIFNNVIWPDFTKIPTAENPCVELHEIEVGQTLVFDAGQATEKQVTVLPAEHSVPAVGYHIYHEKGGFAFSGDCARNDVLWEALNELPEVDLLIMDDQYLESEQAISRLAKHYYSADLQQDLQKLSYTPNLYLTHFPPYKKETVFQEAAEALSDWQPEALCPGMIFDFPFKQSS